MRKLRRGPRERVVEQPTRRRLLHLVREIPGIPLADAARRLEVHYTTAEYHARILRAHGHVRLRRAGARTRAFPTDGVPRVSPDALHPTAQRVLHVLARRGAVSVDDLARALGVPRSTLQWHLGHLHHLGAVRTWRQGPARLYAPTPLAHARPRAPVPDAPTRVPTGRGQDAKGVGS